MNILFSEDKDTCILDGILVLSQIEIPCSFISPKIGPPNKCSSSLLQSSKYFSFNNKSLYEASLDAERILSAD